MIVNTSCATQHPLEDHLRILDIHFYHSYYLHFLLYKSYCAFNMWVSNEPSEYPPDNPWIDSNFLPFYLLASVLVSPCDHDVQPSSSLSFQEINHLHPLSPMFLVMLVVMLRLVMCMMGLVYRMLLVLVCLCLLVMVCCVLVSLHCHLLVPCYSTTPSSRVLGMVLVRQLLLARQLFQEKLSTRRIPQCFVQVLPGASLFAVVVHFADCLSVVEEVVLSLHSVVVVCRLEAVVQVLPSQAVEADS